MSSWVDKVRGLRGRFLNAVGVKSPLDDERKVAGPHDAMTARSFAAGYLVFKGFEKGYPEGYEQFSNPHPEMALKAHGALLTVRAVRDCKSGLWNMRVRTEGDISLSDGPEKACISVSSVSNNAIKPFEDRLAALGFKKSTGGMFAGPLDSPVFEKRNLSDHEVGRSFVALNAMLSQDEKVINLSGTRFAVKPEHRPGAIILPLKL